MVPLRPGTRAASVASWCLLPDLFLQVAPDDRLTLREIVADIPYDPAAIVVYVILLASAGLVWWGNRHSGPPPAPPTAPPAPERTVARSIATRRVVRPAPRPAGVRWPRPRRPRRRAG